MKAVFVLVGAILFCSCAYSQSYTPKTNAPKTYGGPTTQHVHGYTKRDGTYVQPYERTTPDNTRTDNWSSKPNVNPYTGKKGTKDPYANPYGH